MHVSLLYRCAAVGVAALAVTGCVTRDKGADLAVALPSRWSSGATAGNSQPPADLANWWRRFRDPQIDRLVQSALASNPGLDEARERVIAARALARAFWPGPLSLVLARAPGCRVSLLCSAGLATLAVRVPRHGVGQALLGAVGRPLAAPSANPSGALSPTTAAHVAESLGDKVPLILDGGPCPVGLESTVLDLSGADPVLLRPGGVTAEALEPFVGRVLRADQDTEIKSPGMLMSHYAPDRPLRLEATDVGPHEALLAFGPAPLAGAARTVNLSRTGDPVEAAAGLFAALRALDRPELTAIAVMPIPQAGLGAAINDRLRRAAAPRT